MELTVCVGAVLTFGHLQAHLGTNLGDDVGITSQLESHMSENVLRSLKLVDERGTEVCTVDPRD
jgi:hypothetical protein